jgi:hypothetical protein
LDHSSPPVGGGYIEQDSYIYISHDAVMKPLIVNAINRENRYSGQIDTIAGWQNATLFTRQSNPGQNWSLTSYRSKTYGLVPELNLNAFLRIEVGNGGLVPIILEPDCRVRSIFDGNTSIDQSEKCRNLNIGEEIYFPSLKISIQDAGKVKYRLPDTKLETCLSDGNCNRFDFVERSADGEWVVSTLREKSIAANTAFKSGLRCNSIQNCSDFGLGMSFGQGTEMPRWAETELVSLRTIDGQLLQENLGLIFLFKPKILGESSSGNGLLNQLLPIQMNINVNAQVAGNSIDGIVSLTLTKANFKPFDPAGRFAVTFAIEKVTVEAAGVPQTFFDFAELEVQFDTLKLEQQELVVQPKDADLKLYFGSFPNPVSIKLDATALEVLRVPISTVPNVEVSLPDCVKIKNSRSTNCGGEFLQKEVGQGLSIGFDSSSARLIKTSGNAFFGLQIPTK